MSGKRLHIVIILFVAILLSSCGVNRFIPEGKYLVKKNSVVIEGKDKKNKIDKSKLSSFITLKPYRETFETNVPTWIYYKWERRPKSKLWTWMNKTFGKEPVYYDPTGANNSAKQMMRHLDNIGYFNSKVTHSVKLKKRRKRAFVTYNVYPSSPYYVSKIDYVIEDSLANRYIMHDSTKFQLKAGDIYNSYALNEQRDLITERMKNSGYFYFNRNNIYYEVDSNFMNHTMEITMRLKTTPLTFKKYYIRDIHIYPDFSVFRMNSRPVDSATLTVEAGMRKRLNTWDFHYYDKPQVKPQTFSRSIHVIEGLPYNLRSVTNTYKALANYRLFRNVNIEFDSVSNPDDSRNLLDCRITMQQNDVHSFTVQAEGTNSEGDLGIKGSFSYTNKNIFHGAETFQLSLKAGLEAQTILGEDTEGGKFNTKELGLNASLMFPKFFSPFAFTEFARDYQPTTSVALGMNAQVRYYYSRYISTATFSYDWKSNTRTSHYFAPINLNGVKIANINPEFQQHLDEETSQRKKDQYMSHLILGTRYSYTYNTQSIRNTSSFVYLRAELETSGNLLSLFNNTKLMTTNENYHELLGIRYAQYVRSSVDFRQHIDLGYQNWLVFRQFVGLGIPYGNSKDLPFERSFYGGGANGLRGWLYRSVGPGGYKSESESDNMEKTGDIQLELNAEYRFPIYNIFNGALFIDAGNVWTYHPIESMPNGEFKFNNFYKQLAMDAGLGVRIDVSFLILRIDLAYAMRNPYKNENGSYWRFNDGLFGHFSNLRFQAGIGYPF